MKDFGRKLLAILSDVEAWLTFASVLVVGSFQGIIWAVIAGIIVYLVINLWRKERPRINLFGITPPGGDPPPEDDDPDK